MKKNYTFKTLGKGLAIVALALSSTLATAQVATVHENLLKVEASMTFPAGPVLVTSEEIALEGTTFKIQCTITPAGSATFVTSNATNLWGVGSAASTNNAAVFEGDENESATVTGIKVIDFNAGTTSYTAEAISALHFTSISIRNAQHATDKPVITINGVSPGTDIGQQAAGTQVVVFGTAFTNFAGTSLTVGTATGVTSFALSNGSTDVADVYNAQVIGVAYTFTTAALSVNGFDGKTAKLSVYPNPVTDGFSVNMDYKSAQLVDLSGKVLKNFSSNQKQMSASGLSAGMYILKVIDTNDNAVVSKLLVK